MCYNSTVQTSFYASGFLYSLKTHRILLLQPKQKEDSPSHWSTLEGDGIEGEGADLTFQRTISKLLNIDLKKKDIYPIYDYFHDIKNKLNYVFYAEIRNAKVFDNAKLGNLSWFSFSEIVKLLLSTQTKQDIVVGQRVIDSKWRDDEAKKNF